MSSFLNLSGGRRLELVRQSEAAECGLAALAMVAGYHGYEVDLATMRRKFTVSMKGQTLKTLIDISAAIGLSTRPVRCELEELEKLCTPALLHWRGNHFVVLEKARGDKFIIYDPSSGVEKLNGREVSEGFTGVALEVAPTPAFQPKREQNPLKLSSLLRLSSDTVRGLSQSVFLSLVIELLVLASPIYMQMVIDDALVKGDLGFLDVLAISFLFILLFRIAATTMRGLTLQFISQVLSFDMQARLFHHMVRLPLDWFHKRHVGDIQSRFGSVQPIQNFISRGAIAGLLDGGLGVAVLCLMYFYSGTLATIVLVSVVIYLVVRLGSLQLQRRLAGDVIIKDAQEKTKFLEAVRAFETIKASGAEVMRESQQRNAMAATMNSTIRSGNINIAYTSIAQLIDGITDVLVIYLGASAILRAELTVGMLTAFIAYKRQFGMRLTSLIEQFVAWRLLSVDLGRLSDIALSSKESRIDGGGYEAEIEGHVQCFGLHYRYGFGEPFVLKGINLTVMPGEYVAIVGPSGCGKSTLVKLLIGLYMPSEGKVLIEGRNVEEWSKKDLRRQIAVVTQDDNLFAGSIAENIALFDEDIRMEDVHRCARIAQIHEDIVAMPMGYESLVGDMGSSLSGGQKQRVMIARALYRRPRILILDESTSHLDIENEKAINDALADLDITRIVVAHRPQTIESASRRIYLRDGFVVPDTAALIAQMGRAG